MKNEEIIREKLKQMKQEDSKQVMHVGAYREGWERALEWVLSEKS